MPLGPFKSACCQRRKLNAEGLASFLVRGL
jgi:hypothetical protein